MLSALLSNTPYLAEIAGPKQSEDFRALADAAKKASLLRLTPYEDSIRYGVSVLTHKKGVFAGAGFENAAYKNTVKPLESAI